MALLAISLESWLLQSLHKTQLFILQCILLILLVFKTLETLRKDALHDSEFLVSQSPTIVILLELCPDVFFDFAP